MKYKLRSESVVIPGGISFFEEGTKFGPSPVAKEVITALHLFRAANNRPRSSMDECAEDVIDYNGEIRGGNPQFFRTIPGGSISRPFSPPPAASCKGCGAQLLSSE